MSKITVNCKPSPTKPIIEAGDFFVCKDKHFDGHIYILAQVWPKQYALVSLNEGNRWRQPCQLDEMDYSQFQRLETGNTILIEIEQ
jgi:hypothetical protein